MEFKNSLLHYLMLWYLMPQFYCNEYARASTETHTTAFVNLTYKDPVTGDLRTEKEESGRFGLSSRIDSEQGWVVLVRTADDKRHGCTPPVNVPAGRWIALVERGSCEFQKKISNAAIKRNASAVVIYNHGEGEDLVTMSHNVDDVVSIFLSKADGIRIIDLLENGTKVWMQISVGQQHSEFPHTINKTSVLFVSISFIVLMIISLAWLVFYYIQRFRYAHAKERLSKRLMHAARKAISRMPMRTIKNGDKETNPDCDPCAVCIENYRGGDVVRILPCKHIFHKCCVDPWLIEQRSCPMCKLDILKAFGLQINASRESLVNMELEAASTSIGPSELLPINSAMRDDHHIVELVYYPYNVHLRPRLPETRSEAEETITGLEPAIASLGPSEGTAVCDYDDHNYNESEALIPKSFDSCDGAIKDKSNEVSNPVVGSAAAVKNNSDSSCSDISTAGDKDNNKLTVTCVIEHKTDDEINKDENDKSHANVNAKKLSNNDPFTPSEVEIHRGNKLSYLKTHNHHQDCNNDALQEINNDDIDIKSNKKSDINDYDGGATCTSGSIDHQHSASAIS